MEPKDPDEEMKIRRDHEERNAPPRSLSRDSGDQPGNDERIGRNLGFVAGEQPLIAHDPLMKESECREHDRPVDGRQAKVIEQRV